VRVLSYLSAQLRKQEALGASPKGTSDTRSAAKAVQRMFTDIAPRYDLLNHLLSCNVDRLWWRRTARTFAHIVARGHTRVLDLCCGTGDMAFALFRHAKGDPSPQIVGADFSHAMLVRARQKSAGTSLRWLEADALNLPFLDQSFDLITTAFGFRNLADYDAGLRECFRVLRPGGELGILDFGQPEGLIGFIYHAYFQNILPVIGRLISGDKSAYSYLPASVEKFPRPQELLKRMISAGFKKADWTPYTFGIAGLYRAKK